MKRKLSNSIIASFTFSMAVISNSHAAIVTWDGGSGGLDNWNTNGNWSIAGTPANTDDVVFGSAFTSGNSIDLVAARIVNSFTINTLTAFSITGGDNLTITSGQLTRNDIAGTELDHSITAAVILGTNGAFNINGSGTLTIAGTISDGASSFSLTKSGNGVLILSGAAESYNGDTTVSGGVLRLGADNQITNGAGFGNLVVNSGGTFDLAGFSDTVNGLSGDGIVDKSAAGGETLTLGDGNATATFSGTISNTSGTIALTKIGTGTQTFSGSNTHTGVTTISAGVLSVATIGDGGVAGNLGQATNAAANLVLGGGTLEYTGATASTNRNFTLSTGTTSTFEITTNNLTISGASTNTTGGFIKTGAGTLTLTGNNLHTGTTTVTEGILSLARSGGTLAGAPVLVNGGTLDVAQSDTVGAVTLSSGTISGAGTLTATSYSLTNTGSVSAILAGAVTLTKTGAGTATLSGANTYSGVTTVTAGVLRLDHASALGGGNLDLNGGVLGLGAGDFTRALGTGAGQVQWSDASGGFAAYGADRNVNIGGAGATLATSNTSFFGNASAEILILGAADATHTVTFVNGISFDSGTAARTIQADNGAADVDGIISGVIANTGDRDWNKSGTGTLQLNGNNTFTGTTNVTAGALRITHANGLGTTAEGTIVTAGAALQLQHATGLTTAAEALTINGTGISNTGALLNISGNNTYSGAITINSTTRINSDSGLLTLDVASGNAITGSNDSLQFGGAGDITIADAISSGTGTLTKDGNGKLTFSAGNTYSGATSVSAGTLFANNASGSATGTGAVSVASGAIFGGAGTSTPGGANGINVTGALAPGGSVGATGNFTLNLGSTTGTVVMNSAATFQYDLGVAGVDINTVGTSDLLTLAGAAANDFAFNGNSIDFLGTGGVGYYKLFDTSLNATNTWTGLTVGGTGLITGGLTVSNLTSGLSGDLIMGGGLLGGTTGDIYLHVIPEPSAALLAGIGALFLLRRRRVA